MKHNFTIEPRLGLGVVIFCRGCGDPEDEVCNYVWIDWNGDVFYDDNNPETLFKFYVHHDGFGLLKAARETCEVLEKGSPYTVARETVQRLVSGADSEEQVG
jgi:hypothetical protein